MKRMIPVALLLLAACDRGGQAAGNEATSSAAKNVPADDTGKNERDQHVAALTPGDQGGSEADRTVTQRIRQGVVDHESLSINAKNVKIITVDGVVTLRGPVESDKERADIATIARGVNGVKSVNNQLEVAAK